jgi:uncharacterized protein involved in cysteine biosynthesis
MSGVLSALAKACGQLGDRAVIAVVVKSVALTLAVFVALGAGLVVALVEAARLAGWASIHGAVMVFGALLAAVLGWLLFRLVAVAVLQFFADEVVAAVEARHYPALAATARPLPFQRDLANSLTSLVRVLGYNLLALPVVGALLFTAVGSALVFLLVNAVLLGRELTDMAWLRHCAGDARGNPVPAGERALLGAAIAGLLLVPFANVLAPLLGAAAGAHLVLGRIAAGEGR